MGELVSHLIAFISGGVIGVIGMALLVAGSDSDERR